MYYTGTEAHEHLLVVDVEDPSSDQEITQQPLRKFRIRDLRKESDAGDPISNGISVEISKGVIVGIIGPRLISFYGTELGTVADNIRYGPQLRGQKLSDEEVYKLLKLADLDSSFYSKTG
ncbi:hypothetical protein CMV_021832, partial [Castanea mollissima]